MLSVKAAEMRVPTERPSESSRWAFFIALFRRDSSALRQRIMQIVPELLDAHLIERDSYFKREPWMGRQFFLSLTPSATGATMRGRIVFRFRNHRNKA